MSSGSPRRRARELVFRILYQSELTRDSVSTTWQALRAEERLPSEALDYVDGVVQACEEHLAEIDRRLAQAAQHWKLERLAATDRNVLRMAVAELLFMKGTPARVVIDEAVDIARKYGREESGGFANGVLDRVARDTRPGELGAEPPRESAGERSGR